jgi:hypothetical protein
MTTRSQRVLVRNVDVFAQDLPKPEPDVRTELRRVRQHSGLRQSVQRDAAVLEQPVHDADVHADDLRSEGRVLRSDRGRLRQSSPVRVVPDRAELRRRRYARSVRLRDVHAGHLREPGREVRPSRGRVRRPHGRLRPVRTEPDVQQRHMPDNLRAPHLPAGQRQLRTGGRRMRRPHGRLRCMSRGPDLRGRRRVQPVRRHDHQVRAS